MGCIDSSRTTLANLYPASPTGFPYGNEGRNLLHGPGTETVNFSLFKNFPIAERMRFQFRFETFGLFNHTNFNNPSSTFGTSSFGNITEFHRRARHPARGQADFLAQWPQTAFGGAANFGFFPADWSA